EMNEREVTERIQAWLLALGAGLPGAAAQSHARGVSGTIDAVSLRRELVDEGFLERDSAGRRYVRSKRFEARVRFAADAVAGEEILGLIETARRARLEQRPVRPD